MSVSGLCEICQTARATDRCPRCGTIVCTEHFDSQYGYCLECARTAQKSEADNTGNYRF